MWDRVKRAAEAGVLLGVQYGIALALMLLAISWMLGDYTLVRQRALNGQQAFEYLQHEITAKQKRSAIEPAVESPAP